MTTRWCRPRSRKKGIALDGSHPIRSAGYGAYGITFDPFFDPTWLERGGVFAVAHVRGGGEYGETCIFPRSN